MEGVWLWGDDLDAALVRLHTRAMRFAACVFGLAGVLGVWGCKTLEGTAAKDPMRCERNPACARQQQRARDCSTQCSDDPACTDRCREGQVDGIGHR